MWLWELFHLISQCAEKGMESGGGVGRRKGEDKGGGVGRRKGEDKGGGVGRREGEDKGGRGGDDPRKTASLSKGKL